MRIAISTVSRSPSYFAATWSALLAQGGLPDKVDVYVGSPDTSFLPVDERMRVHTTSEEEWRVVEKKQPPHRATWNMLRSLSTPPDEEGLVLLEDDVIFSKNWMQRLREAAAEAPGCIVSGFTPHGLVPINERLGRYQLFYCSQCLFFPGDLAQRVLPNVAQAARVAGLPFDVSFSYCGVPVVGLLTSCVEHMGGSSAAGTKRCVKAARFEA